MGLRNQEATSVGVFGGDPVIGRALEQLLRSAGYAARFLTEASFEGEEPLDGIQLLLFAGEADADRRAASLSFLESVPTMANIPILELVSSLEGSQGGAGGVFPWPCRVDELSRRIEAALLEGSRPGGRAAGGG